MNALHQNKHSVNSNVRKLIVALVIVSCTIKRSLRWRYANLMRFITLQVALFSIIALCVGVSKAPPVLYFP